MKKTQRLAIRLLRRYLGLCQKSPRLIVSLGLLAGLATLWPIATLSLRTDFAELLPENHPAAVALREVLPRQISSTNLVLIVESPDPQKNRRFALALRPKLSSLVGTLFSEITFFPDTEMADAAARHKWHYAELAELAETEQLLSRLLAQRTNPLWVDLEGDAERELKRIRANLSARLPARDNRPFFEYHPDKRSADYPQPQTHTLGVLLWRRGGGLASADDQQMLDAAQQVVQQLAPHTFHPQMRIEWSGQVAMALEEQRAVRSDLTAASTVTATLVLLLLYLHFRRPLWVLFSFLPAFLGVLFALLVARCTYTYLNANTAFLIAIILGNGINTPIVLLSRFGEEIRRQGRFHASLARAVLHTFSSTLSAALCASVAYGTLLFTSLRGLSQFGLVGAVGMLFCFALSFLLLPPLLVWGRHRAQPQAPPPLFSRLLGALGRCVAGSPKLALAACALLLGLLVPPGLRFSKAPLEYDFSKLRTQDESVERRWRRMYDLGLGNLGAGYIGKDAVMLAETPQVAEQVRTALLRKDRALGPRSVLLDVRTLASVLPQQQSEKLVVLARIRATLLRYRKLISAEEWAELADFLPPADLRPLTTADLPRRLREAFTEVDGQQGRLIGIDADPSRFDEHNGQDLLRLSQSLSVTVDGRRYVAASVSTVFAAMLEIIAQDGPRLTALALLLCGFLLLRFFGLAKGWPPLASLTVGLSLLCGVGALFGMKINFLNFVALPITIGIGMEYATNLWARFTSDAAEPALVLEQTGAAVTLCSLTTIVGYGTLLFSQNQALQSFGKLACLGEATCLISALWLLPAFARFFRTQPGPHPLA